MDCDGFWEIAKPLIPPSRVRPQGGGTQDTPDETVSAAITTPWAVLSAGVDHEQFCDQLSASVRGGAAGFIAGRSLWKECAVMPPRERRAFLEGTVRRRFEQLLAILHSA